MILNCQAVWPFNKKIFHVLLIHQSFTALETSTVYVGIFPITLGSLIFDSHKHLWQVQAFSRQILKSLIQVHSEG